MPKKVLHTITRIEPDSRVIYLDADNNELYRVDSTPLSGIVIYEYDYYGDVFVQIYIHHLDYRFLHLKDVFLGKKDQIFQIQQIRDPYYSNPN
jgi:hypothetical protein